MAWRHVDGDQSHNRMPGCGDNVTTRTASGDRDSTDLIVATTIFQEIVLRLGGGGGGLDALVEAVDDDGAEWRCRKLVLQQICYQRSVAGVEESMVPKVSDCRSAGLGLVGLGDRCTEAMDM